MDFNLAESALTIFIAGLLILFFAQFIPRKSKRTKKILLIAKISALIIFIAQSIFGFAYARYCTDKILERERHLIRVSKTISPPQSAFLQEEYMFRKYVFRMYCLSYAYEKITNEAIEYYENELERQGYTVMRANESKLEATNGDILIRVRYAEKQKELVITIMFDDIFTKIG